jgi:hypothetical protein
VKRRTIRHGYRVKTHRIGNKEYPRWIVVDSGNRYWTGTAWTEEITKAALYGDQPEAQKDAAILEGSVTPRRLFTMVTIHVDSSSDFTVEELRDYLKRNFQWRLKDDGGLYPLDTARIEVDVEFDGIEEDD